MSSRSNRKNALAFAILLLYLLIATIGCDIPFVPPPPTFYLDGQPIDTGAMEESTMGEEGIEVLCYETQDSSQFLYKDLIRTTSSGQAINWKNDCRYVAALVKSTERSSDKRYTVYWTSWAAGEADPQLTVPDSNTSKKVHLSKTNELIVFTPVVSMAWEPMNRSNVLSVHKPPPNLIDPSLETAFQEASAYLFDATEGQMIFGEVNVLVNGDRWEDADFRILADNDRRPSAAIGGLRKDIFMYELPNPDADYADIVFFPGHIYLGRSWNEQGPMTGLWSASDGFRTLVHEWGHYALFLYDSYLDLNLKTDEVSCTCEPGLCPTNANQTLMDWHYDRSEFWLSSGPEDVSDMCKRTQQWQSYKQSDWEVLSNWFAMQEDGTGGLEMPSGEPTIQKPTFEQDLTTINLTPPSTQPITVTGAPIPVEEPIIALSVDHPEQKFIDPSLVAQLYTLRFHPSPKKDYQAKSILYQGSNFMVNTGIATENEFGVPVINHFLNFQLLGVRAGANLDWLYAAVDSYKSSQSAGTPSQPYTISEYLENNTALTPTTVAQSSWKTELDIEYEGQIIPGDNMETKITKIAADLTYQVTDEQQFGEIFVQLCTPGAGCSEAIPSEGHTMDKLNLKGNAKFIVRTNDLEEYFANALNQLSEVSEYTQLPSGFPNYSIIRFWMINENDNSFVELIRWLQVRNGAGPGGGCPHAPMSDGNSSRAFPEINRKTCSSLSIYMPAANNKAIEAAVAPNIRAFITVPLDIDDMSLIDQGGKENLVCTTAESNPPILQLAYDDYQVCKLAAPIVTRLESSSFSGKLIEAASQFNEELSSGTQSPTLAEGQQFQAFFPSTELQLSCQELLEIDDHAIERHLQILRFDKDGDGGWQEKREQQQVDVGSNLLTVENAPEGIYVIGLKIP
ncbi:MAG: hypothetical protein AAF614_24680 [Chloroflexota bacterium]